MIGMIPETGCGRGRISLTVLLAGTNDHFYEQTYLYHLGGCSVTNKLRCAYLWV